MPSRPKKYLNIIKDLMNAETCKPVEPKISKRRPHHYGPFLGKYGMTVSDIGPYRSPSEIPTEELLRFRNNNLGRFSTFINEIVIPDVDEEEAYWYRRRAEKADRLESIENPSRYQLLDWYDIADGDGAAISDEHMYRVQNYVDYKDQRKKMRQLESQIQNIKLDPFNYVDDENELIRNFARSLMI